MGSTPTLGTYKEDDMSTLVQCKLQSGTKQMVSWLEPKIKVGDVVTLKDSDDPTRRWDVLSVGEPRDRSEIHRGWHNNI